jgi:uncharacterized protein (DUF1778 family)
VKKPQARDQAITVRVTLDVRHAIEKAAAEEGRTLASMMERIALEWLKARQAKAKARP